MIISKLCPGSKFFCTSFGRYQGIFISIRENSVFFDIPLPRYVNVIDNSTCECNLGDGEDVGKYNWVNPVVPVVLRHDLPSKIMQYYKNEVICDHPGMIYKNDIK